MMGADHLGSGLWVGRARDKEPALCATREGPGRWRATIEGIKDETIVRVWSAEETYPTAAEALAAASGPEAASPADAQSRTTDESK